MYGDLPKIKLTDGREIEGVPIHIPRPEKLAVLRLPTSIEIADYLDKQRVRYRSLGRGKGQQEDIPNVESDRLLFTKLRIDDGVDFDDSEAAYALGIILRCRVMDCVSEGSSYRIQLQTLFGLTEHVLEIPLQADLAEFRRTFYKAVDMPHGLEERRFYCAAFARLYETCAQSVSGYREGVQPKDTPINHRQAVIYELLRALDDLDPNLDPNS